MSANLLSSILDNMTNGSSGARIISQNHDTSKINWLNGVTDPGEMIACGAYQELRRLNGEADDAYKTRIAAALAALPADVRAKIEAACRSAANTRASLDSTTGAVAAAFARTAAWHELGTLFDQRFETTHLEGLPELAYALELRPQMYWTPDGYKLDPHNWSIHRQDTGAKLSRRSVGDKFKPFQNVDTWKFLDKLVGKNGARYESAGSIYGGARAWAQIEFPHLAFKIGTHSTHRTFISYFKFNDGTAADKCYMTDTRAECANTSERSLREDGSRGYRIPHRGDINAHVKACQKHLDMLPDTVAATKEAYTAFDRTPLDSIEHFADLVLDAAIDITAASAKMGADALAAALQVTTAERDLAAKKFQRQINAREKLFDGIVDAYQEKYQAGMGQTVLRAYNAVTSAADFGVIGGNFKGDDRTRQESRFLGTLDGTAAERKDIAYNVAMNYVAAR